MIVALGPSTKRARFEVRCDTHGHISHQTTRTYCDYAISAHLDAGCQENVATYVLRGIRGWSVQVCGPAPLDMVMFTRSSKALALAAARRHEEGR